MRQGATHTLQLRPTRAIVDVMRTLVMLGVLATAACGLDEGGLGADPVDADVAYEGATTDGEPIAIQDGSAALDSPVVFSAVDAASAVDARGQGAPDAPSAVSPVDLDSSKPVVADAGDGAPAVANASEAGGVPTDAQGDAVSSSDAAACTQNIPVGWTLSMYTTGPDVCPTGYPEHVGYASPTIDPSACSCGCTVTQDGDCLQGTITVTGNADNGPVCDTPILSLEVSGSGSSCLTVSSYSAGVSLPSRTQASALPPDGGTCADMARMDPTQVSSTAARYCDVPPSGAGSVCNGSTPPGFMACIAASGALACPPATSFNTRFVVGDRATLECSPCTECSVATTCSNPTISAYDNRMCRGSPIAVLPVDGACDPSAGGGMGGMFGMGGMGGMGGSNVLSVQYSVNETTTCTAGTSTATAQLTNPITICCQ
jgi:hypothetical protein